MVSQDAGMALEAFAEGIDFYRTENLVQELNKVDNQLCKEDRLEMLREKLRKEKKSSTSPGLSASVGSPTSAIGITQVALKGQSLYPSAPPPSASSSAAPPSKRLKAAQSENAED